MILFLILCFVLFGKTDTSTSKTTLAIQDRVAFLKSNIADQLRKKHVIFDKNTNEAAINENVEYEDRENEPITPINEKDPRKKKERFKLKQIRTTRDIGQNFKSGHENNDFQRNDANSKVIERNSAVKKKKKSKSARIKNKMAPARSKMVKMKVADVFYRRTLGDNCSNHWTHCQDLITPYLTGQKTDDMSKAKRIAYDDHVVIRLIQLLTEDITDHTKDDIHSILYQISNLQLRLFQWDVAAIKLLLNVIDRDKSRRHTFKTIKMGLKNIFATWNLHFGSNVGVLMKQTRIFRPPCVKITDNEGSTKTSRTIRYTKSVKKKCSHKTDPEEYDNCVKENRF